MVNSKLNALTWHYGLTHEDTLRQLELGVKGQRRLPELKLRIWVLYMCQRMCPDSLSHCLALILLVLCSPPYWLALKHGKKQTNKTITINPDLNGP